MANAVAVAGLLWATLTETARLARHRPRVVVSVGGYAAVPGGVAAAVLRVPLVLVNVDAVPGLAHRVLGRFAAASAVAFPDTPLPRAVVTGAPVRDEVRAVDRTPTAVAEARGQLGLPPDRPVVGVFGGSLGARSINRAASGLARRWAGRADRSLYHVTGRRDWDAMGGADAGTAGGLCLRLVPFEPRMDLLYQAADVVVCRAGAITVAELAVAGVPAVLVPLPGSAGRPPDGQRPGPGGRGRGRAPPRRRLRPRPARGDPRRPAWPTPAGWPPWGRRPGPPPIPTRPTGWPRWWTPMPAERGDGDPPAVDLSVPRRIHVVGVGGAGMSAIATVLSAMGHTVTGSDLRGSPVVDRLVAQGVAVSIGHRADQVGAADLVTSSPAVAADNPELAEAARRGLPVVRRAEMLAAIAAARRCLAVAGTHGKTTTCSMLSLMLVEAGLRPSFLIGADVGEMGTNAVWDRGEWLVLEADESYGTFTALAPRDGRGHQRRGRPPRPLRHLRRPQRGLRRRSSTPPPGTGWWGPTTRSPPSWAAAAGP